MTLREGWGHRVRSAGREIFLREDSDLFAQRQDWQSWPKAPILKLRCAMPTRNVSLTKELDEFVSSRVEGGLYANASEVMRTALRLL